MSYPKKIVSDTLGVGANSPFELPLEHGAEIESVDRIVKQEHKIFLQVLFQEDRVTLALC